MTQPPALLDRYEPSGRVSSYAPLALLASLPVALLSGWVYGLVLRHSSSAPLPWSLFLGASGLLLTIFPALRLMKQTHARSRRFAAAAGSVWVLAFLSARWVTNMQPLLPNLEFVSLLWSDPWAWAGMWQALAEHVIPGSGASASIDRGALRLLWAGEAVLLLLIHTIASAGNVGDQPYSEQMGLWAEPVFEGRLTAPLRIRLDALQSELGSHRVAALLNLTPITSSMGGPTVHVKGWAVLQDPTARWLDLNLTLHLDQEKPHTVSVIAGWIVSNAEFEAVRNHLR